MLFRKDPSWFFSVAQTFENTPCHVDLWQSLSSQTSRWNMQAHGTPVVGTSIYVTSLEPKNPMPEIFLRSKRQVVFLKLSSGIMFQSSYHTRRGYQDRARYLIHIYGEIIFLYSTAWITRPHSSMLRGLFISSRIISFIQNDLSLGSLLSSTVAQTFENALCHWDLWQSLSSQTSR